MAITYQDFKRIFHKVGGENIVFEVSNEDHTDSTYQYYGYVSESGSWIVQRFYVIADAVIYRYSAGKTRTDYDALWSAAGIYVGGLTFTTFDAIGDSL